MTYKNESLEALVAPTLEEHPELREKAAALINTALDEAAKMLMTGDVNQRATMLKFLLPAVFKASNGAGANTEDDLRREFDQLRGEFRQALFNRPAPDTSDASVIAIDSRKRLGPSTG